LATTALRRSKSTTPAIVVIVVSRHEFFRNPGYLDRITQQVKRKKRSAERLQTPTQIIDCKELGVTYCRLWFLKSPDEQF
jgi:hypothetical protein